MSLLHNMQVAVGVGASELAIVLDQPEYFRGGPLQGQLQVRGGELAQVAEALSVAVQEEWQETHHHNGQSQTRTRTRTHSQSLLVKDFPIPSGAAFSWPFKVPIPAHARLDRNWTLEATMTVPGAVDRHASLSLRPYPSPFMFALKQALCEIAPFTFSGCGALEDSHEAHFDLDPPESLCAHLDGVRVISDAMMLDGFWSGTFEINPQEKSLADRMRAMVMADRVRHPLSFPVSQVQPYKVAPEVVAQLRGYLQPYLG